MLFGKPIVSIKILIAIMAAAWLAVTGESAQANPWSGALGDAKAVQRKTEDIAERLNKSFPYSPAVDSALHMDNAACQLVESIKCGASWEQVQVALQNTCNWAQQVNSFANEDCQVRNDRRIRDYLTDLSKRVERLRCSLDKAYAKTQPAFFPAQIQPLNARSSCIIPVQPPVQKWNNSFQMRVQPNVHFSEPASGYYSEPIQPSHPPVAPVAPIQYRTDSSPQFSANRAMAVAELGIEAIRLLRNR